MGRRSTFTAKTALEICERLANGHTLREIWRPEGMPDHSTVLNWVADDREGFANQYARAREVGYSVMLDELLEIADDAQNDAWRGCCGLWGKPQRHPNGCSRTPLILCGDGADPSPVIGSVPPKEP
jgi:hypothetical protein